jgi:hypothetical protein
MVDTIYTGGCLCGSIRYRATGTPVRPSHCHCGICRRAGGAAFVSWATFPSAGFTFTTGRPARYDSSALAFRQFCPQCGSQLTFRLHASPDTVDVTLASLDDPESIVPLDHIWTSRQLSWVRLDDGLPRYATGRDDKPA